MLGIYCRTSKARKEKYTIENQKDNGIKCAIKLGLPYRIYVDDGISGTLDETIRGGLSDLFRDIKSGELTAVYVVDQSRIERDTQTWYFFVSLCLNNKISYFPGGTELDLDNPTNRMYAQLMSVVNSYYAEITSRKVRDANAKKAKEGKTHGLKPYGYKRDEQNHYVIFEAEAIIVRRMFELSLGGLGAYSIANILNKEGIPTKFSSNFEGTLKRKDSYTKQIKLFEKSKITWRGNVISDILKNPIYKGTRVWRKHEDNIEFKDGRIIKTKKVVEIIKTENHVPPIIDAEIWERVQQNFESNKKNVGPKEQYNYLLNGIVHCGKCGNEYRGKKRPKGNDNAYKCTNKRYPSANCSNRGLNIPRLETLIIRVLLFDIKTFKLYANIPEKKSNIVSLSDKLIITQKEVDTISKRLKNLTTIASRLDDVTDVEEITVELNNLNKKRISLNNTIKDLEKSIQEETQGSFEEKLKNNGKLLSSKLKENLNSIENFDTIKGIVHSLIESITINFNAEKQHYFIKVLLKGKMSEIFITSGRSSDVWSFADAKGNNEFNKESIPSWIKPISSSRSTPKGVVYFAGIKIEKEKYLNFN